MFKTTTNLTYEVLYKDHSSDFSVFNHEHEIFVAYLKKYLQQAEIHARFEATFPGIAKPGPVGAFVGMYVSRWAPVQDPDVEKLEQYPWGRQLIEEFKTV